MGRVPFADATGIIALSELIDDFQRAGARVVLCETRSNLLEKLERAGVIDKVGRENVVDRLGAWRDARALSTGSVEETPLAP